ncbi:MAG: hypothetical protein RLZZ172_972, partial [Bacteroidota bacterium]
MKHFYFSVVLFFSLAITGQIKAQV